MVSQAIQSLYAGRRPALFFILLTVLVGIDILLLAVLGFPELGTNIQEYLRSDGIIVDRYDAYRTAIDLQKMQYSNTQRRLESRSFFDLIDYEELAALREIERGANFKGDSSIETAEFASASAGRRLDNVIHRTELHERLELYYIPRAGGDALNNEVVAAIRKFEKAITSLPGYDQHCVANTRSDDTCRNLVSSLNFYYASEVEPYDTAHAAEHTEYILFPDGSSNERGVGEISLVMENHEVLFYFGKDYGRSRSTEALRSWANFGFPLEGYKNETDRRDEQKEIWQDWVLDVLFPFLEDYYDPTVRVLYHNPYLISSQWKISILRECFWALGSLAFVWTFSVWYTRTLSLATIGILCSCLSFPLAVGIYHGANYDTYVLLNFMSIFLLMGIGADNVFIYFDLWTISEKNTVTDIDNIAPSKSERTVFTLDHGGRAIFACALTTAGSFLANMASTIGPVREFGFFVGMVVICNVFCFFILFPLAVVTFDNLNLCCSPTTRESENRGGDGVEQNNGCFWNCVDKISRTMFGRKVGTAWIVKFYMPVLYKLRWLFIMFAITMVLVTFATVPAKFVPTDRAPVFFEPGQHNLADIYDTQQLFSEGYDPGMERYQYAVCRGCDYDEVAKDWRNCSWVGPDCDIVPCMHLEEGCGGRGQCLPSGYCDCYTGYEGADCKISTSSDDDTGAGHCDLQDDDYCNSAGDCKNGVCFCYDGWMGKICEIRNETEVPDEEELAQPQDCRWSDWTEWSHCSCSCFDTCGIGNITRERIMLEPAKDGGKCYGQRKQTDECIRNQCKVDCEWGQWSAWSVCSVTCGEGSQRRDRDKIAVAQNGGLDCDGISEDEKHCVMDPCPIHCQLGPWTPVGECSATCGGGYQEHTREILTVAEHGGDECPTELKKNLANKIFGYLARCEFWLKIRW